MKSSVLPALFFLLFVFAASAATNPVLDVDGDPLRTNASYFIVSAIIGSPIRGLNLAAGRSQTCPLDVIQEYFYLNVGFPLKFSPANSNDKLVYSSTDLNIKFTTVPINCNQPPMWKVDNYDESTGKWYISTNGVEGNPGAETLSNWFKFEKTGTDGCYTIVHCPKVCESCFRLCSNVSPYSHKDGVRRLALGQNPFPVQFLKAD